MVRDRRRKREKVFSGEFVLGEIFFDAKGWDLHGKEFGKGWVGSQGQNGGDEGCLRPMSNFWLDFTICRAAEQRSPSVEPNSGQKRTVESVQCPSRIAWDPRRRRRSKG